MQQRDYESKNRNSYDYFSNSLLWVYSINSVLSAQVNLSLSSFRPEETDGIEVAFIESARNDYGLNDFAILNRLQFCIENLDPFDPFNPNTALSLTAPIPNFQPPYNGIACFNGRSFSLKQDTVNFQLGLQYQWTENSSLNLLVGRTLSETQRDVFDPTNAILTTGELTGNYVQETEKYNLSYIADIDFRHSARIISKLSTSQSQEQTAYGVSSYTRRLVLSNNWQINEFSGLNINISHVERNQSFTSTNQTLSDSTFRKLSISYMQQWNKYFSSNFSYIYGEIENNAPKSGKRNRFMFTLTWQPKVFRWSK